MITLTAKSAAQAWIVASEYVLLHGDKLGDIIGKLNVAMEITEFEFDKKFDAKFREIFGNERIDVASNHVFITPEYEGFSVSKKLKYKPVNRKGEQITDKDNWKTSYFSRMCKYKGKKNQIETAISALKKGINVKTCGITIADGDDFRTNSLPLPPCLIYIDFKPINKKLHMTAIFRSQRLSKSGYADYHALIEIGKFVAEQSNNDLHKITTIAHSCHVHSSGKELRNTKELLEWAKN